MKRVMIVGAGAGQVPLIRKCKSHGLYTIVISPFGPYPGIGEADKHIDEDIFNKDSLVKIGQKEEIDYVISDQSDYAVPIVAYVAEKLNLPGNSVETAETYTYKSRFRAFCHKKNIPSPKSIEVDITSDIPNEYDLQLPVVVKPSDSQGSRGISKVWEYKRIPDAINQASKYARNKKVIIEEFFEGKEIVCEGFVIDGQYINIAFGDREYFDLDNLFIPSKTRFPVELDDTIKQRIINNEKTIAKELTPRFGIVHSEYLVNREGKFVIIESALRGGGVYIASHLIPYTTGVDLTEVLINAMQGNLSQAEKLLNKDRQKVAEYLCFYMKEGKVSSVPPIDCFDNIPQILISEINNINVGDISSRFEHKGMRKGPFIIGGKNLDEVRGIENFIKEKLNIEIDGEPGVVWD